MVHNVKVQSINCTVMKYSNERMDAERKITVKDAENENM